MKNVVIVHGQLTHGGSERQLFNFLRYCDREAFSPHLVISGELGYWEEPIRNLGVPITLLGGSPAAKMMWLRRYCHSVRANCLFSWVAYTNVFGLALVGSSVKRISSFRNAKFTDLPDRFAPVWRWASLNAASTLVCNSVETRDSLLENVKGRQRLVYIPNGVEPISNCRQHHDLWRKRLGIPADELLIVGVGRLAKQKNFKRFIESVVIANQSIPCHAVIAGPDAGQGTLLKNQVKHSQLPRDRIRIIDAVSDARELICAADIFLLSSDHEGMPNVIMEAMAAGVTCVSTPVNGINALIDHDVHGLICNYEAASLAAALVRLARNSDLRSYLATNAKRRIEENYVAENIAQSLWALC